MIITVSVKQLGKRKPTIEALQIDVPGLASGQSLTEVIQHIVAQQVAAFHQRIEQPDLVRFLLPSDLQRQADQGKITFGDRYNQDRVDLDKAQKEALLAFSDGLYKVFIGDDEIEQLDDVVTFDADTPFTFIRLTFLSGGYF